MARRLKQLLGENLPTSLRSSLGRRSKHATNQRVQYWALRPKTVAALKIADRYHSLAISLDAADTLHRHGEDPAAAELLERLANLHPESASVLVRRVKVEESRGGPQASLYARQLVESDLKSVTAANVAQTVSRVGDDATLDILEQRLVQGEFPNDSEPPTRALTFIELARMLRANADPHAIAETASRFGDTTRAAIDWARAHSRWPIVDELDHVLRRRFASAESVSNSERKTLQQVASGLYASGAVTRARDACAFILTKGPDTSAEGLLRRAESELELLAAPLAERTRPTPPIPSERLGGPIAYLLHNSMPYNTGGYATRSHGLITAVNARGWEMIGSTRAGYPLGTPESRKIGRNQISNRSVIDGATYLRSQPPLRRSGQEGMIDALTHHVVQADATYGWQLIQGASNSAIGTAAVRAAHLLGIPSIYEVRGLWEVTKASLDPEFADTERYHVMARQEAEACILADRVFAITNAARDLLIERGVDSKKITILPNGVDIDRFSPLQPNKELKERLGLGGKVVIGYLGSVRRYEGLDLLLHALRELVDKKLPVAFLLVGDGDGLNEVKRLAAELGLLDHIVMTGRVPHEEIDDYYSIVDIAPFPRLPLPVTELISPLKPFEALALEKAVIVSDVAALAEIIQDRVTGLVAKKGSAESLAESIAELVEDEDLRNRLAANGREWVLANRSWAAITETVESTYRDLGLEPGAR